MDSDQDARRTIRSFVLREGRMTPGQQRAFAELWPRFGLDIPESGRFDFQRIFDDDQPVTLEIGFGNGDSLAAQAEAHPAENFVGIEVHRPGVGHLLIQCEQLELDNVRAMRHDAVEVLRDWIAPASLARVQLFFPDPWHKTRHHKRRIVQPAFLDLLHAALRPGGVFHAATDWQDYARHMLKVLRADERFKNLSEAGDYCPRPGHRPLTKFEQRGQRLGHGVWDLMFKRV